MTLAFVDTGAWIALLVPRDAHHPRARRFFLEIAIDTRLVTSNYVLAETATWLAYHDHRQAALQLRDMVQAAESTNRLDLEWITPEVFERAWRYFERFDDHVLSFCDCTSFALCGERNVDFVFGFDSDFHKAGFDVRP